MTHAPRAALTRAAFSLALLLAAMLAAQAVPASAASNDSDGDGLRNNWETHKHVTSPGNRDTDGNGIRDGSEDPDHDGVSNLGEQRFNTNPGSADSDGDGTPDSREDSNDNGVPDGLEQDHRHVPANLKPSLKAAPNDTPPSYSNGCHTFQGSAKIHPCVFGDPNGSTTVALFGDSHALQWEPALDRAAKRNDWRLVVITKSACPSVDVRFRSRAFPNDGGPCKTWRERAIVWLRKHVPDVLIVSNSRGYTIVDANDHVVPRDPAWGQGLDRTLSALPSAAHILVIGDSPHMDAIVPSCLAAHMSNISACETSRGKSQNRKHDDVERTTAEANGASFRSLSDLICSYDPCPVLAGNVVMWRNDTHLTATWVVELWPSFAALVNEALASGA